MSEYFKSITPIQANELLLRWDSGAQPQADFGRFLVQESSGNYTTIDNTAGKCEIEKFKTRFEAVKYLCGVEV